MTYRVAFKKSALKYLENLDPHTSERIMSWIKENLAGCEDPRRIGKSLSGRHAGKWRYRVGEYRIIAEIRDKELIIAVVDVGPRKNVYTRV